MGTVLHSWLRKRISDFPTKDSEDFGNCVSDGTVLAKLLHSYGLIHCKVVANIIPSDYISIRLRNLRLLRPLLIHLKIPCDNNTLQHIAEGKGTVALRMFYKLFYILEDENYLQNLLRQKESEIPLVQLQLHSDMPQVSTKVSVPVECHSRYPLTALLKENVVTINKHKKEYKQFLDACKNKKKIYKEMIKHNLIFDNPCMLTHTEDEIAFSDDMIKSETETYNKSLPISLKTNKEKQGDKKELLLSKGRDESRLSTCRIWKDLLQHQEKEFKEIVVETLLKQAQHERRIVENVFETYHEKKEKEKEYEVINQILKEKREKEADLYMLSSHTEPTKCGHSKYLDIHKQLYKAKQERKYREYVKICKEIIENIIDITMKMVKQKTDQVVPGNPLNVIIKCTVEMVMKLENFIDKNIMKQKDIITQEVTVIKDLISEENFMNYVRLTGDWDLRDLNLMTESHQENLNITSHIIHKLLKAKYPRPSSRTPANLPKADIAAVVIGLTDKHAQEILQHVLNKRDVYVVTLDTVIKFCTDSYKEIQEQMNAEKVNSPLVEMEVQEINEKSEQYEKNESENIFPQKVILGQKYLQIISEVKEEISDELLTYMIVEYLKSLSNLKGWVLLDYPVTYEQASIFEEILTGTKFPENLGPSMNNMQVKKSENEEREFNVENKDKEYLLSNSELDSENPEKYKCVGISHTVINNNSTRSSQEGDKFKEQSNNNKIIYEKSTDRTAGISVSKNDSDLKQNLQFSNSVNNIRTLEKTIKKSVNIKLSDLHVSKILPNPQMEMNDIDTYETYLTAFIVLNKMDQSEVTTEPTNICLSLKMIYSMQNIYHELLYNQFDIDTILKVEKIIASSGKFSQQSTEDEEIDGKIIYYEMLTAGKKEKSVSRKRVPAHHSKKSMKEPQRKQDELSELQEETENTNKRKKKESQDKVEEIFVAEVKDQIITNYNEEALSVCDSEVSIDLKDKSDQEKDITNEIEMDNENVLSSKVREEGSKYVNIEQSQSILKDLASKWEIIEESYFETFKQIILLIKIHKSLNEPYTAYVIEKMNKFLEKRNSKKYVFFEFQKKINDFVLMFQQDITKKDAVLCKLTELWSDLLQIYYCINKDTELYRQELINENWVSDELCMITNLYLECFRLECDRFVKTCEIFDNYYNSMLDNPSLRPYYSVRKSQNNVYADLKEAFNAVFNENNIKTYDSKYVSLTHLRSAVVDILINMKMKKNSVAVFCDIINKAVNTASDMTERLAITLKNMVSEFESLNEKNISDCLNDQLMNGVINSDANISSSKIKIIHDIFDEWQLALQNEINRLYIRLNIVKTKALKDLEIFMKNMKTLFVSLKEGAEERYRKDVAKISELCNNVYNAIEQNLSFSDKYIFNFEELYNKYEAGKNTSYSLTDSIFEIDQLDNLYEKLTYMSPSGIVTQIGLVYMIQDILVCNSDDIISKYLPNAWRTLEPNQIPNIVVNMFGSTKYICWKHLIIHALNLRYPTQKELLSYESRFKSFDTDKSQSISQDDYNKIYLWFENYRSKAHSELRLRFDRIKQFLFKLFARNKMMNYKELLLSFCKDENPKEGLAKAIALFLGKEVLLSELLHHQNNSVSKVEVISNEFSHCNHTKMMNDKYLNIREDYSSLDTILIQHSDDWNGFSSSELVNLKEKQITNELELDENIQMSTYTTDGIKMINGNISESETVTKLSCDFILQVLKTAIPWYSIAPVIPQESITLEEGFKETCEELQSEGLIYIADFLNHKFTDNILSNIRTFQICNIREMIESAKTNSLN